LSCFPEVLAELDDIGRNKEDIGTVWDSNTARSKSLVKFFGKKENWCSLG
jgi:hypothetical protein